MASITLGGNAVNTSGNLPAEGSKAPDFTLVAADLSRTSLGDFAGKRLIVSIFPSIDTGICAKSTHVFAEAVKGRDDVAFVTISADLPFAAKRWCGAEGVDNAMTLSTFDGSSFGDDYGIRMVDGKMAGFLGRAALVIDGEGNVVHSQLVPEIAQEPDYDAVLAALG
ncbi:MAG: thiol peroxidase [Deltaproteobacteria bacterium]|nr:thiol peroxidase [Deltaproteobacteria bacterium]